MPLRAYGWLQRRGFLLPRRTVARFGGRIHQTMMGLIRGDCPLLWLLEQKAETRWLRAAVQLPSFLLLFLPFFYQRHALDLMLGISTIKNSSSKEAAQKKHSAKVPDRREDEQRWILKFKWLSSWKSWRRAAVRSKEHRGRQLWGEGILQKGSEEQKALQSLKKTNGPHSFRGTRFCKLRTQLESFFLWLFFSVWCNFSQHVQNIAHVAAFLSQEGETAREKYRMSRKVISTSQLLFDSQNFFIQIKQTHNRHPPALSFPETNTQD